MIDELSEPLSISFAPQSILSNMKEFSQRAIEFLFLVFGFSLPFSVAAGFFCMGLITLLTLLGGHYRQLGKIFYSSHIAWAGLAWWLLHSLGWIYSSDTTNALEPWKKATYLAFIPVFMTSLRPAMFQKFLGSFLVGLSIYHLIVHALHLNWIQIGSLQVGGTPFIARIHYSPILVFGILLLIHWQRRWKSERKVLAWILLLSLLVSLISTQGRSGQVLLTILLPLWVLLETHSWKRFLLGLAALLLIGAALFFSVDLFSERYRKIQVDWEAYQTGNIYTSMGQRFHHLGVSWKIFQKSPLFGHGTGSYLKEHDRIYPHYEQNRISINNPHNQFLIMIVQFGLIGIVALLSLFFVQVRAYQKAETHPFRPFLILLPSMFLILCMIDTHLYGVPSLTLFIYMSTILYHPGWEEEEEKEYLAPTHRK